MRVFMEKHHMKDDKPFSINRDGRRKYVRVICNDRTRAYFTLKCQNGDFYGQIFDINYECVTCIFDDEFELSEANIFDMIINLDNTEYELISVLQEIRIFIDDDIKKKKYVFNYEKNSSPQVNDKIHKFLLDKINPE